MNSNTYNPTAADRRRWNKEDGQEDQEQLAKAAATLRLSLTAALLKGKPLERSVQVPCSTGPWSAFTVINEMFAEDSSDKLNAELLGIIGDLAARITPDPLSDRAAAWVDSVAHAFGVQWAQELADEWAADEGASLVIPLPCVVRELGSMPTAEQFEEMDAMAGIAA